MNHEDALREICQGEGAAYQFCMTFLRWAHALDDIVDEGASNESLKRFVLESRGLLTASGGWPFFWQHREGLYALITSACMAYLDSNRWAKSEDLKQRVCAEVLKSYYHEVFWHVAYLVGGIGHQMAMTAKYRDFDFG